MYIRKAILLVGIIGVCGLSACVNKESKDSASTAQTEQTEIKQQGIQQQEIGEKKVTVSKPPASAEQERYDYSTRLSETENGYYFFSFMEQIQYVDKNTMEAAPLCFEKECSHPSDESCQAFVKNVHNLQIYNGKLYVDITEENWDEERPLDVINLYCMDLDGSHKEKVVELLTVEGMFQEIGSLDMSFDWVIVNDKVYICGSQIINDKKGNAYLDVYSLKNGEKIKRIYEEKLPNHSGSSYSFEYYEKKNQMLYFKKELYGEDETSSSMYKVNTKDHSYEMLWEDSIHINDRMYENKWFYTKGEWLVYYNLKKEKEIKYIPLDDGIISDQVNVMTDEQYIYMDENPNWFIDAGGETANEQGIKIYQKKKLVDTLNQGIPAPYVVYNGEDRVLFDTGDKLYYFDKNAIGTGQLELKEINK